MTVHEFKAWFQGYTEGAGKAPPRKVLEAKLDELRDGCCCPTYPWRLYTFPSATAQPPTFRLGNATGGAYELTTTTTPSWVDSNGAKHYEVQEGWPQ